MTHCAVFYCVRSQLVFSCTIAGDLLHSSFSVFFGLFRRGGRLAAQFERVLIQKIDDFEHDEMPLRRPQSAFFVHAVTDLFYAAAVVSACVRLCFFALLTQPIVLGVCV